MIVTAAYDTQGTKITTTGVQSVLGPYSWLECHPRPWLRLPFGRQRILLQPCHTLQIIPPICIASFCCTRPSTILFPTLAMEREQRSLGSGSVSTKEFQDCLWEGLGRVVEKGHATSKINIASSRDSPDRMASNCCCYSQLYPTGTEWNSKVDGFCFCVRVRCYFRVLCLKPECTHETRP